MNKDIYTISNKIIDFFLKGIIFVLPLFFLPITTTRIGMDFFNKEYLLWLIIPIVFFVFIFKIVSLKGTILKTKFDKYILIYLGLLLLSATLSVDRFSSFFGAYGSQTQSVISIVSLLMFFYIIINHLDSQNKVEQIIKIIVLTYSFIVLIATVLVLGILGTNSFFTKYFILAVGNLEDLSVYLAVINIIVFAFVTNQQLLQKLYKDKKVQWFLKIIFSLSLIILTLINYYLSWLVLFVGVLLMIGINRLKKIIDKHEQLTWKLKVKNNIWTTVVLILSIIFLINHFSYGGIYEEKVRFYQNLQLDISNSLQITIDSIKNNFLLGSGPETYSSQFSLYRSSDFNKNGYWALRFNQGSSFMLELLATTGFLPSLAYLSVLFYFIIFSIIKILKLKNTNNDNGEHASELLVSIWLTIVALVLLEFVFPVNIVLRFLLWLFMGVMLVYLNSAYKQTLFKKISIYKSENVKNIAKSIIFLLLFICIVSMAYEIRFWVADTMYAKIISLADSNNYEKELKQAIRLNKHRGSFYATLSKYYFNIARKEIHKDKAARDLNIINENINKSISIVQAGLEIDSDSVILYETLGMIYRTMSVISENTGFLAKLAFAKASELEPTNPVLKTELAKSMFVSKEYDSAIKTYKEAIDLKNDYSDAYFNLARVYIQTGENGEALKILNNIAGEINDPEYYYERGRANYNEKNYIKAIEDYKVVLNSVPLHSNALYSIGLALKETEDYEEALTYLNKALIVNPDSDVLNNLIAEIENY